MVKTFVILKVVYCIRKKKIANIKKTKKQLISNALTNLLFFARILHISSN